MTIRKNIIAFFIMGALGTAAHFVYTLSGENELLGLFFPVNESVWEHLKLIFYPPLLYSLLEYKISGSKSTGFLPAVVYGIICGMATIIAVYYIAGGIIGRDISVINIGSYFAAVAAFLLKRRKYLKAERYYSKNLKYLSLGLIFIFAFLFAVWSVNPPRLGIFTSHV